MENRRHVLFGDKDDGLDEGHTIPWSCIAATISLIRCHLTTGVWLLPYAWVLTSVNGVSQYISTSQLGIIEYKHISKFTESGRQLFTFFGRQLVKQGLKNIQQLQDWRQ